MREPETLVAIAVVAAVGVVAVCCTGCGASAVRQHATAATVLAVATAGAARTIEAGATADAEASCPDAEEACMARLRGAWAPADVAVGATRAALLAYTEALSIAQAAGDGADLWGPLGVALARVLGAWDALAAALRELGLEVPGLPAGVLELVRAVGGGA